jgi:predicted acylesterase/phospholipase RssA
MRSLPKRLVFCGGGTRCLVFLQTLVELEKQKQLINVNEYWGTSAGALLASLLAISKSATQVKDIMFAANYSSFRNIDINNMLSFTSSWGLDDGNSLVGEIERLFEIVEPGSKTMKLRDISGLHIVVSDLTTHSTVVCNANSYPNMRVIDAIRASMSLPIFFRPYIHENGHYMVDGAIRANFPWHVLPSDDARKEALGFTFEKSWIGGPKTFMEYIFSMVHFDEPKKVQQLKNTWSSNIIWYPTPPFPAWFVRLCPEDFELITSIGAAAANNWLTLSADLASPPEKIGNLPAFVPHHIPSQGLPPQYTGESLGIQTPSRGPFQDSSPPQLPQTSPSFRRWSV